ncbi:MAG TPA: hypothetical protein PKD92_07890 [Novosphingobium sp.]|nr:hypothetical protein [Novosphingobium sp.]
MPLTLRRIVANPVLIVLSLVMALPAQAQVLLSFHSFNGSMMGGRYPHTFIVMEGTLEADGTPVNENYGYTSVRVTPEILSGDVDATTHIKKQKYITTTNRHFTVPISDAQYRAIVDEVRSWRDAGRVYNLDTRNCIHFVARIAQIAGLRAEVPRDLTRKPRAWLNLIGRLNPQLGAREFR